MWITKLYFLNLSEEKRKISENEVLKKGINLNKNLYPPLAASQTGYLICRC